MNWIPTNQITLTDPHLVNAQNKLIDYLLSFDENKLLYEFYQVAQLQAPAESGYQGWERSDLINFRGHFPGHYLSASALAFQATKDSERQNNLYHKIKRMVTQLAVIQEAYAQQHPDSAGYLSAFREVSLDEVEGKPVAENQKENNLVPWYILHKMLVGLLDVYDACLEKDDELSQVAIETASRFGDYIYQRLSRLNDKELILRIEYGGMNDALYRLFTLTQNPNHHQAASYFDELTLFHQLAQGQDVLSGKHANTTIPKLLGALSHYETTENASRMYLDAAINFWDIVIDSHTYATGGNSQSEHFHAPHQLHHDAAERVGDCTCETCNTYNMLKLSRRLYTLTHQPKYLDYYERTYINAILGSQNPETGMMMYFQPMDAGYNKVFNRPYDEFWCCTGTGIESFAKLADTFYFTQDDTLYINSYFSNQLSLPQYNLHLDIQSKPNFSQINITAKALDDVSPISLKQIAVRLPQWSEATVIKVDGIKREVEQENGFGFLVADVQTIEVSMQARVTKEPTTDNPDYAALVYGPFVLASRLGQGAIDDYNPNGILVRVGTKLDTLHTTIQVESDDWINQIKPIDSDKYAFAFEFKGKSQNWEFVPYYQIYDERYGIYHEYKTELTDKEQARAIVDSLTNFDHNNSEYAKHLQFEASYVASKDGKNYRIATENGWFAYEFNYLKQAVNTLRLVFHRDDSGKTATLTVNGIQQEVQVPLTDAEIFIEKEISLEDSNRVAVRFEEGTAIFGIYLLKETGENE